MNNIKSATPDGMKDYLFEECEARGIVENTIINTFESYGYAEVITSPFEYYDVFNLKSKNFQQETMYKFTDFKGKLIVARPDCTIPIARLAATRLREEINPIKLYYSQNIFRVNPKKRGMRRPDMAERNRTDRRRPRKSRRGSIDDSNRFDLRVRHRELQA